MYRANLNSRLATDYINPLAEKNYLNLVSVTKGPPKYFLTSEGRQLLEELGRIEEELAGIFYEPRNKAARVLSNHTTRLATSESSGPTEPKLRSF